MGETLHRLPRVRPDSAARVDAFFLDRAIDLAFLGAGRTLTNPMVGAVVVRDGVVVGEGYHEAFGHDHAETVALDRAGDRAAGATMYVTLEPCTHHGKTPPCVGRIVESRVRRVVVCTLDPDPRMDGQGVAALRDAGIEVEVGARAERAIMLNLPYFKRTLGLGFAVTIKMASTLDGRIASGSGMRDAITGPDAQRYVHRLRAANDAVLIGIDTLLIDEPHLDCRTLGDVSVPTPIVLDTRLRFPESYRWIDDARSFVVVCGNDTPVTRRNTLSKGGATIVVCPTDGRSLDIRAVVSEIAAEDIQSVLVEGGARVMMSFLMAGLWDGLHMFVAPRLFGSGGVALAETPLDLDDVSPAGVVPLSRDVLVSYLHPKTRQAILERVI